MKLGTHCLDELKVQVVGFSVFNEAGFLNFIDVEEIALTCAETVTKETSRRIDRRSQNSSVNIS